MKKLFALMVVLGLVASANAAPLLTEDFNDQDISDWTFYSQDTSYGAYEFVDDGGGDYHYYKPDINTDWDIFSKSLSASVSSGTVYIQAEMKNNGGYGRPAGLALLDANGDGAYLAMAGMGTDYMQADLCSITDLSQVAALSQTTLSAHEALSGNGEDIAIFQMSLNLDTGAMALSVDGSVVDTATMDLTLGAITTAVVIDKKRVHIDDVEVDIPEPATMALLGFGGLGMLIRRKR